MIQEELKRQRAKEKESKKRSKPQTSTMTHSEDSQDTESNKVIFDEPCCIADSTGNDAFFTAVTGKTEYRQGLVATTYTVRPILTNSHDCPLLALKEIELKSNPKDLAQSKKQLLSLENKLKSVKKLNHQNLLKLIDFRIDRDPREVDMSTPIRIVRVLTPLADKGPLDELLELTGQVAITKVRSWTTDLLSALGYLHSQGLVHEDIHPGNILLFREGSGHVVPKLADATYQRELHAICRKSRTISSLNSARSTYWLPPELDGNVSPNQKTDIWDFGVVVLQMIFGLDVYEKYSSPSNLINTLSLSTALHELVAKFFKQDPSRRPRALDLRSSEFLATDAPVLAEDAYSMLSPSQSLTSLPQAFSRRRLDSTTQAPSFSRFKSEFYEEGRLGKGGFGEVVKVRKKIDGQTYAIKKIKTKASRTVSEILKEVSTLSALSHPAIVRYYDAWIEELPDSTDTEGETSTEGLNTQESMDAASDDVNIHFATSTGGLDFMSSANLEVEFGYDDSESEDENGVDMDGAEDDEQDGDNDIVFEPSTADDDSAVREQMPITPRRTRSHTQSYWKVLYILMEYCEKKVG
jgi:translation initiation factor 2-alpha kinase 4